MKRGERSVEASFRTFYGFRFKMEVVTSREATFCLPNFVSQVDVLDSEIFEFDTSGFYSFDARSVLEAIHHSSKKGAT